MESYHKTNTPCANPGQVGPESSRPGSTRPGQLGLYGGPGNGEGWLG